ncbi:putative ABC transport system permease protein [Lacibacter cauensis]|uniref:Putative ABC transport system permease protein n=1 Tax=Lacibacter cauensis TaxID=510947 RepID=A0A562SDN5_9BACT|nr:ABC transporter permease [Lacibacter cauensis]TWI79352.1 putative ABC transport system permease protein [Lacibacter cauensis]
MFKNYIIVAWRNLLKNKTFSLLNIVGLAVGLACFILITMYVMDELSYDKHNEKAERIYRINSDIRFGGNDLRLAVCSDPMGATLKKDYPQVEQFVRIYNSNGSKMLKKGTAFIEETKVAHADSTIFDVFTLPMIAGNPKTALSEPNTVVISKSAAEKYFGTVDAIGKGIEVNDEQHTVYKVTAVIKDMPQNAHFNYDFIFSMDNVEYGWGNFLSHNFQTYVLLQPGTDYKAFNKNFKQVIDKYILPQAKQLMQINSMEDFARTGNKLEYSLMPMLDIHLYSDRFPELGVNSSIQYVYIFSAVALFILLIACVNFMNLSTARSSNRAKEVGIRKVLGTGKKLLIGQFLTESTLMVFIGLLIAIGLVWLSIGYFNNIAGKTLGITMLLKPGYLLFLLLIPVVTGVLAGLYPAFFLSSFQPIAVLKGRTGKAFSRSNFRSALVIFQFFTSIVLIISTIVVFKQLNFIQNAKIGFNKDQMLIVNGTWALNNNADAFRNEVAKMSGVKASSFAGYLPVSNSSRNDNTFSTEAVMNEKNGFNMQVWNVDYDYIPVMGMEVLKGRNFSKEYGSDSTALIINETAAKMLGFDDPVGKKLYTLVGNDNELVSYTIVAVVKNFNYESLRKNVGPLSMRLGYNKWATAFKVSATDVTALLKNIETKWKSMAPDMPFSYQFLDDSFDNMYRAEQRIGKVALSFALLAIFIACLGLFGLAAYMAEQRTKEIGVRKVLGASVTSITTLLSKDFVKLVCIASLIAFPVAWWAMSTWLRDFAYRVSISWWVFGLAGFVALLIAVLTVSSHAIKAALTNPVKSLRNE